MTSRVAMQHSLESAGCHGAPSKYESEYDYLTPRVNSRLQGKKRQGKTKRCKQRADA
ncbi:hypothetical protein IG631_04614 [Alternaria alternata]|nr:hypothetical protein IG631_04614 [Alternaria alternata]